MTGRQTHFFADFQNKQSCIRKDGKSRQTTGSKTKEGRYKNNISKLASKKERKFDPIFVCWRLLAVVAAMLALRACIRYSVIIE